MALLKFLKGNYSGLSNAAIAEGQILICGDTGEMFVDVAADKRVKIGDFITVANIAALEALDATAVPTSRLYYVEDGNILARSNGTSWVQVNKQKTADELKTMLGLGSMAYVSEVAEDNLSAALKEKVNAASEGNHSHNNKALLDTYTQTEADLADAVAKKHEHANKTELDKVAAGDVAKWNAVVADHLVAADKTELADSIADVNTALGEEVTRAKAAEKVNADAIAAIKDDANIDSFADVVAELAKKQNTGDYATKAEAQAMADGKDEAIAAAKKAGDDALAVANTKTTMAEVEGKGYQTAAQVQTIVDGKDEAIAAAKKAGDDAQAAVDALAGKVGEVPTDKTVVGMIADAQAAATYDDTQIKADIKANADAIDAIEADYLKAADKYDDTAIVGRVAAIEADYLKAADKYDDTALKGRVEAIEGDYLKAADKKALQDQIDLIVNNPDTENVINSINEFTQYIEDHGEIAEGFRTDIDANEQAIIDEAAAARAAEGALSGRIDTLEAIDHDAYVAADTALKNELNAEIAKKVDKVEGKSLVADTEIARLAAMSDGANKVEASETNGNIKIDGVETVVYTHPAAHAISEVTGLQGALDAKANSADVYAKTETYNKSEVEALLTWGSF